MKTIQIKIPDGKEAKWVNGVLTLVDEQPQDITERIKTFDDACQWCYKNGKEYLVSNYEEFAITYSASHIASADILAYLKLRIITCALNEGWEPSFKQTERRYVPRFDDYGLIGCANANCLYGNNSHMLSLKNVELAEYAATQFKDIYMDFCYKGKE